MKVQQTQTTQCSSADDTSQSQSPVPALIQFNTEKCVAERTAKSSPSTRSTYTIFYFNN